MMRVAFDYQVFLFQEYGGISRYYSRLASSLNRLEGVEAKIFAPLHVNAYLAELPAGMVKGRFRLAVTIRRWPIATSMLSLSFTPRCMKVLVFPHWKPCQLVAP